MEKNGKPSAKKQLNKKKQHAKKRKKAVRKMSDSPKKKRRKKQEIQAKKKQRKQLLTELGLSVLAAAIILWLLSLFLFSFVKMEGYGMLNIIRDSDVVFVNKKSQIV